MTTTGFNQYNTSRLLIFFPVNNMIKPTRISTSKTRHKKVIEIDEMYRLDSLIKSTELNKVNTNTTGVP